MNLFLSYKKEKVFICILIFYSIIGIAFILHAPKLVGWDYYCWHNIAQKYADGYFKEALNAYWSPLIIWLMVPFVKFNFFYHSEIPVLNFIAGFVLLLLSYKLTKHYKLKGYQNYFFLATIALLSLCIQVVYYNFSDFLAAVCLLAYLTFVSDERMRISKTYFIYASILGACCIFGKSFYTYFVLIHLSSLLLFTLYKEKWRSSILVKNYIKTLISVLLIIALWVSLLSWKYTAFTISSSGKYNFALATPTGIGEHFSDSFGLFPPPDNRSWYHWVDPTYYPIQERTISLDAASINYNLNVFRYNSILLYYSFSYFSYFKIAILSILVLIFLIKNKQHRKNLFMYFFSALLIMLGYGLVLIEERYFCGVQLLFFIVTYMVTTELLNQSIKNSFVKIILITLVCLSFMKFILFSYTTWLSIDHKQSERILAYENRIIKKPFMKGKKIATSLSFNEIDDLTCYEICSKNNNVYFGSVGKHQSFKKQYADLKKHNIDYLLYYGCSKVDSTNKCISKALPSYLKNKKYIYEDIEYGVRIYDMKPY